MFQVISTVIIVASTRIRTVAAANAERHPESQRARLEGLAKKIRWAKVFKTKSPERTRSMSVVEVRKDLQRRATMQATIPKAKPRRSLKDTWTRITSFSCFRGFSAYLTMAVPQWYLGMIIDFFLSGQPDELKLGYGSTSVVLSTVFASGLAVWTHFTITKPSNKKIFDHFPKGGEVLIELWPLTCSWAVAEHITMSGPLALSRTFGLKQYAFDADSWNTLDEAGQQTKVMQFGLVFLMYLLLVALMAIPATMTLRRVHASMLSDEDLAIVPFHRGDRSQTTHPLDQRSKFRRPGLKISEAWATITWDAYLRVLFVYMQYFALNQFVQMAYWSANWRLHQVFEVDKYATTNLPCSPVGRILPLSARNNITGLKGDVFQHSEL